MDLDKLRSDAEREFAVHRLVGWTFELTGAKRRLGVCKYRQKRIEIGEYYALNSPEAAVRDTLMHEIAHALAGPRAGHGPAWKAVAVRLGATPRACDNSTDIAVTPGDWQTTCPACGRTYHRYKKPRFLSGYHCKCPARSPLVYEFKGDPDRRPDVPLTAGDAPGWKATCSACSRVHTKARRPRAGVWECRCGRGKALVWSYENPGPDPTRPSWRAECAKCGRHYHKTTEPKPGIWCCQCSRSVDLVWRYVPPAASKKTNDD